MTIALSHPARHFSRPTTKYSHDVPIKTTSWNLFVSKWGGKKIEQRFTTRGVNLFQIFVVVPNETLFLFCFVFKIPTYLFVSVRVEEKTRAVSSNELTACCSVLICGKKRRERHLVYDNLHKKKRKKNVSVLARELTRYQTANSNQHSRTTTSMTLYGLSH